MHSLNCSMRSDGGATLYAKVWKRGRGGGDPNRAFLLLFDENSASRTSVNDIPNIVFFPNPASDPASSEAVKSRFPSTFPECRTVIWSTPGSRNILPDPAIHPPPPPHTLSLFFLSFALSPQSERLELRLADAKITFAEFRIFFKNSWFHWCEVFTALQLIFTDLALIFCASFAGHLKAGPQITFSYSSRLLTSPDFLHYSNRLISEQFFKI